MNSKCVIKDYIFFSLLFAFFFILIPWQSILPEIYFNDRLTYKVMVESGFNKILISGYYESLYSYIGYEWLWEYITYIFYEKLEFSFNSIFLSITFFNIFLSALLVAKYSKNVYILFLLNPWYFDFIYSQSRLSLAISLIYLAFFLKRFWLISIFICISCIFIHTSVILFLFIYLSIYLIDKYFDTNKVKIIILIFLASLISFLTGELLISILGSLGDRRADAYTETNFSVGLASILPWCLILILILIKNFNSKKNIYYSYLAIFFLTLSVLSALVFGGYSLRYLMVGYPIILISLSNDFNFNERKIFFLFYFIYLFIGWFLRFFILWS